MEILEGNVNSPQRDQSSSSTATQSRNRPFVDENDVLRSGSRWIALSPIEARLTRAFLDRPGSVLGRKTLGVAGWPAGVPNNRSVDSRIKTLRPRLAGFGIDIHTIRGHGYLAALESEDD